MKDEPAPPTATPPTLEHRTAQAMVATFMQMTRSANLAQWLHKTRQRSLERRVRAAKDMKEIVRLQRRLDAQQSQAAVIDQAADRFRERARDLAQFAKAGLTMAEFERMGVHEVVDVQKFAEDVARIHREAEAAAGAPAKKGGQGAPAGGHSAPRGRRPPKRGAPKARTTPATATAAAAVPVPAAPSSTKTPTAERAAPHKTAAKKKHPTRKGPSHHKG